MQTKFGLDLFIFGFFSILSNLILGTFEKLGLSKCQK